MPLILHAQHVPESKPGAPAKPNTDLSFYGGDWRRRSVRGCRMSVDKAGRYWLWSEQLRQNLATQKKSREECLLAAIDALLLTVQLRDERIAALQRVAD